MAVKLEISAGKGKIRVWDDYCRECSKKEADQIVSEVIKLIAPYEGEGRNSDMEKT